MYEDSTKIRFEIEVAAQRLISQYMINNEAVGKELESGIKKAFESFNFEEVVSDNVKRCIEDAIRQSTEWGKIREIVKQKTDLLVEQYMNKAIKDILPV